MTGKKFGLVDGTHGISKLAGMLRRDLIPVSAALQLSKMDYCAALANAIGQILRDAAEAPAGAKGLPREEALKRMDDLRQVMQGAYDLNDVKGEG